MIELFARFCNALINIPCSSINKFGDGIAPYFGNDAIEL